MFFLNINNTGSVQVQRFLIKDFFFSSRVSELLDYTAEELTGQSMYALCHGEDVHKLKNTHEDCKF